MDDMYKPGISFRNPKVQYGPIEARKFNIINYVGKQRVRKYGPFPPLWRRAAKAQTMRKLGVMSRPELASFGDVGLGEATVTTQPQQVQRNFWGSLVSLVTTGADIAIAREQTKAAAIRADIATREATSQATFKSTGLSLPMMLGLGGGALLVTMLVLRKKK